MKRLFLFYIILFLPEIIFSQNKLGENLFNEAENLFLKKNYSEALSNYQKVDSIIKVNDLVKYRIAICELNLGFKSLSLKHLLALESKASSLPIEYFFYTGKAYHMNYDFVKAISFYIEYRSQLSKSVSSSDKRLLEIDHFIENLRFAKELYLKPINVEIKPVLGFVNSPYSEYTPIITPDEKKIYFTSRRPENIGGLKDHHDNDYYEDIYFSEKSVLGWNTPQNIGNQINTNNHDAIVGITEDGQKLLIYKHAIHEIGNKSSGDLYYSDLDGDSWGTPIAFENGINTVYFEPSASLSTNENIIYFASDKPGGFGGTDLYVSKLQSNGKWSKPENLGKEINTPYNEDAPLLMPDGKTFYFSSQGHLGMGGADIFVSKLDSLGNFSKPQNLGYPINTPDDEIYFSWTADGKKMYFSAIREDFGKTNSDIYTAEFDAKNNEHIVFLKGKIVSSLTQEPLSAIIKVYDIVNNKLLAEHHSNKQTGNYQVILPEGVNYRIMFEKNNFLFNSLNLNVPVSKSYLVLEKNINLDSVMAGRMIMFKNVFFEHNTNQLLPSSHPELDEFVKIMDSNKDLYIEIVGNIDDINDVEHNKFLSESRAVAIAEYLTMHGVNESRIISVGYATNIPNNKNIEELIEHLDPEIKIISNQINKVNKLNPKANALKYTATDMFEIGSYLKEHIYFPENEALEIHGFSINKLNHIAHILKNNPGLKIRIEAHYDDLKNTQFNEHLAEAREKLVYDYLVKQGIDETRLSINTKPDSDDKVVNSAHENVLINRKINFKIMP